MTRTGGLSPHEELLLYHVIKEQFLAEPDARFQLGRYLEARRDGRTLHLGQFLVRERIIGVEDYLALLNRVRIQNLHSGDGAPGEETRADTQVTSENPVMARIKAWSAGRETSTMMMSHYRMVEELGRGGMGIVYKAVDTRLDRTVALKVLKIPDDDREAHERFVREARTLAALRHPNIVGLHEFGTHEGTEYFTMEYVSGPTLDHHIAAGDLSAPETALIVRDVALALHHVHDQGILHRDLKPRNILMARKDLPKVTDFGLAKSFSGGGPHSLTETGVAVGTAAYMSPEQIRSAPLDPRSDVFSLGVILYECLTFSHPFAGSEAFDTFRNILDTDPSGPRSVSRLIPRDLESICLKAIEKDPVRRYASTRGLAEDIERHLTGEPVLARPISRLRRIARIARRRPGLAAALGVALVALAGLWAYVTLRPGLLVALVPPGTKAWLDGLPVEVRGRRLERKLRAGNHTLRLVRDGYHPVEYRFGVVGGARQLYEPRLVQKTGRLSVLTSPTAAAVRVEGASERMEGGSPLLGVRLPVGRYLVGASKVNHFDASARVDLEVGRSQAVHLHLPAVGLWRKTTGADGVRALAAADLDGDGVREIVYVSGGRITVQSSPHRIHWRVRSPLFDISARHEVDTGDLVREGQGARTVDLDGDGIGDVVLFTEHSLAALSGTDGRILASTGRPKSFGKETTIFLGVQPAGRGKPAGILAVRWSSTYRGQESWTNRADLVRLEMPDAGRAHDDSREAKTEDLRSAAPRWRERWRRPIYVTKLTRLRRGTDIRLEERTGPLRRARPGEPKGVWVERGHKLRGFSLADGAYLWQAAAPQRRGWRGQWGDADGDGIDDLLLFEPGRGPRVLSGAGGKPLPVAAALRAVGVPIDAVLVQRAGKGALLATLGLDGVSCGSWKVKLEGVDASSFLAAADIDGDGNQELLVGHGFWLTCLSAAGGRVLWVYRSERGFSGPCLAADLDRSGVVEIVVGGPGRELNVLSARPQGPVASLEIPSFAFALTPGLDLDGDGDEDVLVVSRRGVEWFALDGRSLGRRSLGLGTLMKAPRLVRSDRGGRVLVHQVADGALEVVLFDPASGRIEWRRRFAGHGLLRLAAGRFDGRTGDDVALFLDPHRGEPPRRANLSYPLVILDGATGATIGRHQVKWRFDSLPGGATGWVAGKLLQLDYNQLKLLDRAGRTIGRVTGYAHTRLRTDAGRSFLIDRNVAYEHRGTKPGWSFVVDSLLLDGAVTDHGLRDVAGVGPATAFLMYERRSSAVCVLGAGSCWWRRIPYSLSRSSRLWVAELDGDGIPDLVVATSERILALSGRDGSLLWSLPGAATISGIVRTRRGPFLVLVRSFQLEVVPVRPSPRQVESRRIGAYTVYGSARRRAQALSMLAIRAWAGSRNREAIELIEAALAEDPSYFPAAQRRFEWLELYKVPLNRARALDEARKLAARYPRQARIRARLAATLAAVGRAAEGLRVIEQAIGLASGPTEKELCHHVRYTIRRRIEETEGRRRRRRKRSR